MPHRSLLSSLNLLTSKRFGTFWLGSLLSNLGTWMQQIAEPWLVLSLTHSPILVGLDAFAMDAPVLGLTLVGGILADRLDKRHVIFFFQSIQMFCPAILIILLLIGWIPVWAVIFLSFIVGITDALSMPAFQSIVPSIVKKDQIENAIALNSTQFNLSRVLGPALAGLVMAHLGPMGCFSVNVLSYLPFIAIVFWVLPKKQITQKLNHKRLGTEPWYSELRVIGKNRLLRGGLLTVFVSSFLCGPLISFAPVIITNVFHSTSSSFGWILSALGAGGLLGASGFLLIDNRISRPKLSSIFAMLYGAILIAAGLNQSLWALSGIFALAGVALTISNTSVNSILQGTARDSIRGQAASLYMLAMRGGLSLGSLTMGFSVHFLGISQALVINGTMAILIQGWLFRKWACSSNVSV